MKTIHISLFAAIMIMVSSCQSNKMTSIEGKVKRETLGVTTKMAGRILKIYVSEGDQVSKGDTLAVLELPEVKTKISQAKGAVLSADAQFSMAKNGATDNQLKQLAAKQKALNEQLNFAEKSYSRIQKMYKDSLVSGQQYDEVFAKLQGAKAQYAAVQAEWAEAQKGVREEQKLMALGQKDRALGALDEANVAYSERYIIAPADMSIETIALHEGELATPGYTLFNGYLMNSTYFRISIPESSINQYKKGDVLELTTAFGNQKLKANLVAIKQLAKYADITSAYPDYVIGEALYELKAIPQDVATAQQLYVNSTVLLERKK